MAKLIVSQILNSSVSPKAERIDFSNGSVNELMQNAKSRQRELLKLKEVNSEQLKQVVQL